MTIGAKFLLRERLRMMPMRVQSQQHGRTFLDNADSRVTTSVNAPFVAFGQSKPAFQIQVVARPIAATSTSEQSCFETGHHTPHLLTDGILVIQQVALQRIVKAFAFRATAACWIQRSIHFTNGCDIPCDSFLCRRDQLSSPVDTTRQSLQRAFCGPPFFACRLRAKDCRTDSSASAMRSPGGCSGAP